MPIREEERQTLGEMGRPVILKFNANELRGNEVSYREGETLRNNDAIQSKLHQIIHLWNIIVFVETVSEVLIQSDIQFHGWKMESEFTLYDA